MSDLEKVIKGLKCCELTHRGAVLEECCNLCPYQQNKNHMCEVYELLFDARQHLKAQEPRVLTLDELRALYDTVHFVWVEDHGEDDCFDGYAEVDIYKEKVELFEFGDEVQWEPDNDNYGKTWRCWSSRPTDEQREAVKWYE